MKQEKTYGDSHAPNRSVPLCCPFFSTFFQKTPQDESLKMPMFSTCSADFIPFTFTGKERDEETGYGYFGARYMDHELMTMWLSVDPMSDKYPSLSPYAYCAWNPVKLVDPDGKDTIKINLDKGTINLTKAGGDHSILYYKNEELVRSNLIEKNKGSFRTQSDEGLYLEGGKTQKYHTDFLQCSNSEIGEMIFKTIAEFDSPVEWDYYAFKQGGGELSSSGIKDRMIHSKDRYTTENVKFCDHFHPNITSDSFFPSYEDQDHAKELKGVRCTIYCAGRSMDFGDYVPSEKNGYINLSQFRQLWNRFAR